MKHLMQGQTRDERGNNARPSRVQRGLTKEGKWQSHEPSVSDE